ncbi:MAG: 50S ribosomal protein L1 [Candidatus Sumerlaeota bacterium]|nr:50S ribosomal protein L1 [Candidatus Sumerlaeota bacterium]
MKAGKNIRAARAAVDHNRQYELPDAVALLKKVRFAKFDESVDMDIRLGVDPRAADQQVRGSLTLPHGTGKTVRVAVFAQGEKLAEAEAAGADVCGGADLVQRVQEGFLEFDAAVATPDMMRDVGKLGKILGPRGMMPNPKAGTVTMNIAQTVKELKAGKIEYRVDRFGIVHNTVGKSSFSEQQLHENAKALLDAIVRARPAAAKGQYLRSVTLSSTMSPGIRIKAGV